METPNTSFHTRSLSFPSTTHPLNANIEDNLRRLSASQAGSSSSSSICQNLYGIKDLYEQMNGLIHLPHNQRLLCQEVEEVLDGSLALLDISSCALDALSQMKESILDLQSAIRRGSKSNGISAYLMSRKKICKTVSKCLVDLKKVQKSCALAQPESDAITVRMLNEAEVITLSTLKSLLSYIMGKKATSWSLVTKLMKSKNMSCDAEITSEVEKVDRVLRSLSLGAESMAFLKQLEILEMTTLELEDGLESVSRCLLKTRVSLLSVLNH